MRWKLTRNDNVHQVDLEFEVVEVRVDGRELVLSLRLDVPDNAHLPLTPFECRIDGDEVNTRFLASVDRPVVIRYTRGR